MVATQRGAGGGEALVLQRPSRGPVARLVEVVGDLVDRPLVGVDLGGQRVALVLQHPAQVGRGVGRHGDARLRLDLLERQQQDAGVARAREPAPRVAVGRVLRPSHVARQVAARQPQSGPRLLQILAGFMDGVVARLVGARAQLRRGVAELLGDDPAQAGRHALGVLEAVGHPSPVCPRKADLRLLAQCARPMAAARRQTIDDLFAARPRPPRRSRPSPGPGAAAQDRALLVDVGPTPGTYRVASPGSPEAAFG